MHSLEQLEAREGLLPPVLISLLLDNIILQIDLFELHPFIGGGSR
jgi:hypothetical protein